MAGEFRVDAEEQSELNRRHDRPADSQGGLKIRFNTPQEAEIQSKQVLDLTIDSIRSQLPDPSNPLEIGQAVLEFALDKNPYTAIGRRMIGQGLKSIRTSLPEIPRPWSKSGGSITDHRMSKLITPEGVTAIYGTKKLGKRVLGSDAHGGMSKPVFHHIIGKKIRYRFQQKMQQFDPKGGKGRLEALDKKYNLEAGSGDNAGLSMDTGAHGAHHDTSRVTGIEPWDTKAGKTLSKLKGLIDNAKTIEELEYLYDLYLKHSVIPDLDKAIKYQRGYEILGSPTVVDKNLLSKTADEWGTRMKDINEVRATEAQRQMGEYDAVADELKQLNSNRYNAF